MARDRPASHAPDATVPLFNGSLECEFRKYQLFNGKFKEFRSENADREFKPRREEIRPAP